MFTLAVFSACVVNYYFFVGQVLFVIIYFLMITLTKTYKFKVKNFLLLALEVIIGFLATAFILLPSVLGLIGNPRLAELPNGWDSLVYGQPQKYWLIILSLFSPQICLRSLCSHPAQIADGRLLRHGCRLSE